MSRVHILPVSFEQGMRKMAAYVCHYNLSTDNLTLAEALMQRGQTLFASGGECAPVYPMQ